MTSFAGIHCNAIDVTINGTYRDAKPQKKETWQRKAKHTLCCSMQAKNGTNWKLHQEREVARRKRTAARAAKAEAATQHEKDT